MPEVTFQDALKAARKKFPDTPVMTLSDAADAVMNVFSTGSLKLDQATGIGGIPCGRVTEIYGTESSGKTTIALNIVANAQKEGKACLYVDFEQALDIPYAMSLGVQTDPGLLAILQPDCAEDALEVMRDLMESGTIGLVVVDSVAQMSIRQEMEGNVGDANMGKKAMMMGQLLRMTTPAARRHDIAYLFINQVRDSMNMYTPTTTPGGKALKFGASIRIELRAKSQKIGDKDHPDGNVVSAKVVKNKMAPPFRNCEFTIRYGQGIDLDSEIVDLGKDAGLWTMKGSWFYRGEEKLANGRDNMLTYIKSVKADNTSEYERILNEIREYSKGVKSDPNHLSVDGGSTV